MNRSRLWRAPPLGSSCPDSWDSGRPGEASARMNAVTTGGVGLVRARPSVPQGVPLLRSSPPCCATATSPKPTIAVASIGQLDKLGKGHGGSAQVPPRQEVSEPRSRVENNTPHKGVFPFLASVLMLGHHAQEESEGPGCHGCAMCECPAAEGVGPVSGWRLGLAAMGLFLGPIVLAIVGAACCRESQAGQLLGAVAGLVVGMVGAVAIARLFPRLLQVESPKKTT